MAIHSESIKPLKRWSWNKKRIEAAQLVAEQEFSYVKIAKTVGIDTVTLEVWRVTPEFATRVKEIEEVFRERVLNIGIAVRENRIAALDRLHQSHKQIVEARGAMSRNKATKNEGGGEEPVVPGGETGFMIIEEKLAGYSDEGAPLFREQVVFDQSLSREYRAVLAQAAEETGQYVNKHELTGKDGGPVAVTVGVMDDIAERVRMAKKRAAEEPADVDENLS